MTHLKEHKTTKQIWSIYLQLNMPRKEYLQKKRRVEAEESATKCQKLTYFFGKETGAAEQEKEKAAEQLPEPSLRSNNVDCADRQVAGKVKSPILYQGYFLDVKKIQEKVGNDILSVYHEKIG